MVLGKLILFHRHRSWYRIATIISLISIFTLMVTAIPTIYADSELMMTKDINPGSACSCPESLTAINNEIFFTANDGGTEQGYPLWKSDGTTEGTLLVKFIPGASIAASSIAVVGHTIFFAVSRNAGGPGPFVSELWKSDGTTDGTILLKSFTRIIPSQLFLTDVNGTLFFSVDDVNGVYGIWKSDGTADGTVDGTVMVKDVSASQDGSIPFDLSTSDGTLFFIANDGRTGNELWKSDGTEAGTSLVKDIVPGPFGAFPAHNSLQPPPPMRANHGVVFFSALYNGTKTKLWRTDGTADGTQPVADATAEQTTGVADRITIAGSQLFFIAANSDSGYELWGLPLPVIIFLPLIER